MSELKNIEKLSIKDFQKYIVISKRSAERLYSDIKKEYNIPFVTVHHLLTYLKLH